MMVNCACRNIVEEIVGYHLKEIGAFLASRIEELFVVSSLRGVGSTFLLRSGSVSIALSWSYLIYFRTLYIAAKLS